MSNHQILSCLEVASELGERFPDQTNNDIIEHVEFVCKIKIGDESILRMLVLEAYDKGEQTAIKSARLFGIVGN